MSFSQSGMGLFSSLDGAQPNPEAHNLKILKNYYLIDFCSHLPRFAEILKMLQVDGYFLNVSPVNYTMQQFLETLPEYYQETLHCTPEKLVYAELNDEFKKETKVNNELEKPLASLTADVKAYVEGICEIMHSLLAMRNYQIGLPDNENVSELEHGLQAGKIALMLGMDLEIILAMLLHDSSRPTHIDPLHGNKQHHIETDILLQPLGLSTPYSLFHGFAKYLLVVFCEPYSDLISPVSRDSLKIQQLQFAPQIKQLSELPEKELAPFIYKLMFLRLIDDFSKVPALALHNKVDYFSQSRMQDMMMQQIKQYLNKQIRDDMTVSDDFISGYREKLSAAKQLIERARLHNKQHEEVALAILTPVRQQCGVH